MTQRTLIPLLILCLSVSAANGQVRDGELFDPGIGMSEPSELAPEQLSQMVYVLGQWDVAYSEFRQDTLFRSGSGLASITLMNRGHGIMERMYCAGCADSLDINTLSFLGYNTAAGAWNLGEANGLAESIAVHAGDFEGEDLVLRNAIRRGGGAAMTHYRTRYKRGGEEGFVVEMETSADYGASWALALRKEYVRRPASDTFLAAGSKYGSADPSQPEEARGFDFLVGTFDAPMKLLRPDGTELSFQTVSTAVYAMNGQAILEYGWNDENPSSPDAATSIVRLYNRAMQRWESLYMTNRNNGALFFGGVQKGDEIVLSMFEADIVLGPIQRWVFHDISEDEYHWYGAQSTDRGETYLTYWVIDMMRREE